jgi:hypothetical protein
MSANKLKELIGQLLDVNDDLYILIRKMASVSMPFSAKSYSEQSLMNMKKNNPVAYKWVTSYDKLMETDKKLSDKYKELTGNEWVPPLARV